MPSRPKLSTAIFVKITPELKSAAESAAEQDRRSLSDWIRCLIEDAVTRQRKR